MQRRPQGIFNKESIVGNLMVSREKKKKGGGGKENSKYDMIPVYMLVKMN